MKKTLTLVLAAAAAAALPFSASAQSFPEREIRIVVPWNPGGSTDIMARTILPILEDQGVEAVVENLPGGGSAVGMGQVATARPDGYTVGLGSSSILALIAQDKVPFGHDSFSDITRFSEDPLILVVAGDSEWDSLEDFMAHMKDNPDTVTIGTPGTNNVNHAMAGLTGRAADVGFRHVPYPGGSRVIAEVLGDQIDAGVLKPSETLAQIEAGELKALGVYRDERIDTLPETETFSEAGYDVFASGELAQNTFLAAPEGLEPQVRDALIEIFRTAVTSDAFQAFAEENGFIADGLSGEELHAYNAELVESLRSAAADIFVEE